MEMDQPDNLEHRNLQATSSQILMRESHTPPLLLLSRLQEQNIQKNPKENQNDVLKTQITGI